MTTSIASSARRCPALLARRNQAVGVHATQVLGGVGDLAPLPPGRDLLAHCVPSPSPNPSTRPVKGKAAVRNQHQYRYAVHVHAPTPQPMAPNMRCRKACGLTRTWPCNTAVRVKEGNPHLNRAAHLTRRDGSPTPAGRHAAASRRAPPHWGHPPLTAATVPCPGCYSSTRAMSMRTQPGLTRGRPGVQIWGNFKPTGTGCRTVR